MASLNDIESQLDVVNENLSGGITNSVIYDVIVDEGEYTLSNDKTFADIKTDITKGKMPILRYVDTNNVYYMIPSISATADTPQLSWYMIRPVIEGGVVSITILTIRENLETTNKFLSFTITLTV